MTSSLDVMTKRPVADALPRASAMVGRLEELAELEHRLSLAEAGGCQLVLVLGPGGIGKTRLVEEFERKVAGRGIQMRHGRFDETGGAFPYSGFFDVVAEHLRADPLAAEGLRESAPELAALFPALAASPEFAALLGGAPVGDVPALQDPTTTFETLARTLQAMAAGRPLVVILDALHAADVSVDGLEYLVRRLGLAPVLLVGIARSDEITKRHPIMRLQAALLGNRRFGLVDLGPPNGPDYADMVAAMAGGRVSPRTIAQLREVTEANPLFTSELIRSLLESGRLSETESGTFQLDARTGHLSEALPESINEAVRRRVDALPPVVAEAIEIASVLGREFKFEQFEGLVAASSAGGDAHDLAAEFVNRGLLVDKRKGRDERLVFSSGVLRDVLYAGLSRRRRKLLHRRSAEQLEHRFAGHEAAVLPQLVLHYSEADVPDKVIVYGLDLAERSLAARAAEDAANAARAVIDALTGEDAAEWSTEGRARRLLAEALVLGFAYGEALRQFGAAALAYERAGESGTSLEAVARAARVAWEAQLVEEARRWVTRGLEVADRSGAVTPEAPETARATADLLELGATLANLDGEYERAHLLHERADRLRPDLDESGGREIPRGGRLVVGLGAPVAARHPVRIRFSHEADVLANVYETLVTVDDRGRLTGGLAAGWTSKDDGRVFDFALRKGVQLHDGRELKAGLACAAINAAIATAGGRLPAALAAIRGSAEVVAGTAWTVAGVSAISQYDVRIELTSAVPIYPAMLADPATALAVPSGEGFAGTGPFRVAESEDDGLRLARNAGAWHEVPRLDEIEFRVVETSVERAEGLRFGKLDVVERLDDEQRHQLASRRDGVRWIEVPQMTVTLLAINPEIPLARKPEVLRAVTSVATSHEVAREASARLARPADVLLPPGVLGHDANRRRDTVSEARAADLVRSPGLRQPVQLEVACSPALAEQHAALVAAMVERLAEIGVEATVPALTHEEYLARLESPGETGAILMRWRGDYPDPDGFMHPIFDRASGLLGKWCGSEALDELLAGARAEQDAVAREQAYFEVERLLSERGLAVPLMHEVSTWAVGSRVRGLEARASAPHLSFASAGRAEADTGRGNRGTMAVQLARVGRLDPLVVDNPAEAEVMSLVFEPLLRASARAEIVPWLAEAYRVEERGRWYWFRLRDGVRFHDGRRLTTRDVRYSVERMLRTGSEWGRHLESIQGAKAMLAGKADRLEGIQLRSDREFVVELDEPLAILPAQLSDPGAAIVPEGTGAIAGTWRSGCVGTGPFRVADSGEGRVELEANPDYWRHGFPRLDRIAFEEVSDEEQRVATLYEGRIAGTWLTNTSPSTLGDGTRTIRVYSAPHVNTVFAVFNSQRGPLADEQLRRRLVESVDSVAVAGTQPDWLRPAWGIIPPGLLGHQPVPDERARRPALLADRSSLRLTCRVLTPRFAELAESIGEMMGVSLDVGPVYYMAADVASAVHRGSVHMFVFEWNSDYPDPDGMVSPTLHSKLGIVGRLVASDEVDRLIEHGRHEPEAVVRRAIYRELEEVLRARAFVLPIGYSTSKVLLADEVEGVEINPFSPTVSWEKLALRETGRNRER
jgi:ABC-type transport system substrate-binding protein